MRECVTEPGRQSAGELTTGPAVVRIPSRAAIVYALTGLIGTAHVGRVGALTIHKFYEVGFPLFHRLVGVDVAPQLT